MDLWKQLHLLGCLIRISMASISYGILVCNEHRELGRLLSLLVPFIRPEDEIVVLIDQAKATYEVYDTLAAYPQVLKRDGNFDGDFAKWRNLLTELCSKDWVFQIDADEVVPLNLIRNLSKVISQAEAVDAIAIPRINTVLGLTQEDIEKWHWSVTPDGIVNWPDYQVRLFRNNGTCQYKGAVHEHLDGVIIAFLPTDPGLALIHPKTIERQRKQNELYATYV